MTASSSRKRGLDFTRNTILNCDFSSIHSNVVVYNTRHSGGLVRLEKVFAGSAKRITIIRTTEVAIV